MGRIAVLLLFSGLLMADEGMWTLNNFPSDQLEKKYGFAPDRQWLDHVRLSSVRLAEGCSASFVSPQGLVLTNHHCAAACIQQISTAENDYSAKGFSAKTNSEERPCTRQEANVLVEISDVTPRVMAAIKGLTDQKANEARKAEFARIEKACATDESVRCEVISLYGGGIYNLYKYRRYQDVRLVFAPETAIAFFGGDPDNFMFPRYNLDISFLRVYENGKPLQTEHYLQWSPAGAKEGDLTFTSGNPGSTKRQDTIAMLETERDVLALSRLLYLAEYRGVLTQFQTRGPEQQRIVQNDLLSVENSYKAYRGELESLLQRDFFEAKRNREREFQKRVQADAKLRSQYGTVWTDIAAADRKRRQLATPMRYWELFYGFRSTLFSHARRLVRMAEESTKPNDQRLPEFTEARNPEIRQATLSPAPIYPELEIEKLTFSLTKLREALGPDDPDIRRIFGKQSPRDIATEAVKGSKLTDPAVRKKLLEGGKAAIDQSDDAMIALARKVDPIARAVRKKWEDEVESVLVRGTEKLAAARFAVYGTSLYPDATFTLRLSYGTVKGWVENGKVIPPFTIMGGAFERHTGAEPFALPQSWLEARDRLKLTTPYNFVSTNDIIGGNSGSPVIDKNGQLVGVAFDGNIHSLGGNYGFDETLNRMVAVHSSAIIEALDVIYKKPPVLSEIRGK